MSSIRDRIKLYCNNAGFHDCKIDLHSWGPGIRQVHILHLVTSGRGFYETGGKKHSVKCGQAFLIYPGETVKYYPDTRDPFSYTWIDFGGSVAEDLLFCSAFSKEDPITPLLDLDKIAPLFNHAHAAFSSTVTSLCDIHALKILTEIVEQYPSREIFTESDDYAQCAANYISANIHKSSLKVQDVADRVGVCRAHLYRVFKQKHGMSPMEFITEERLQLARNMLKTTSLPIKTIAVSVGYSDALYFSLAFKKKTGKSPLEYRKSKIL